MTRVMRLAGLEPLNIGDDSLFVNVGERTNVTGSRAFAQADPRRRLRRRGRGRAPAGRRAARRSSTSTWTRRCSTRRRRWSRFLNLIAAEPDIARVPVMIDSSKWEVIEAGLKCVQGKPIVNSISLKEGEAEFLRQAKLVRRYGAAVDRDGVRREGPGRHASSARSRSASALRPPRRPQVGFPPEDIIFDPNVFAIATGIEEHNNYAVDFIDATRWIRAAPAAREGVGRHLQRVLLASAATSRCARRSTRCSSTTRSAPG